MRHVLLAFSALLFVTSAAPAQVDPAVAPRSELRAIGKAVGADYEALVAHLRTAEPDAAAVREARLALLADLARLQARVALAPAAPARQDALTALATAVRAVEAAGLAAVERAFVDIEEALSTFAAVTERGLEVDLPEMGGPRHVAGAAEIGDGMPAGLAVRDLLESAVYSITGHEIGEVEDLILQRGTGHLEAVVVGHGGLLGLGEERLRIPWNLVTIDPARLEVVVALTREELGLTVPPDFELLRGVPASE